MLPYDLPFFPEKSSISCGARLRILKGACYMELISTQKLAAAVKRLRLEMGVSQNVMADSLGMSRSSYAYKENGKIGLSLIDLQKLAAFFGFPPETFFHLDRLSQPLKHIRSKQKNLPEVSSVNELKAPERDLIGMLRVHQALLGKSDLVSRFQKEIVRELSEFYSTQEKQPNRP